MKSSCWLLCSLAMSVMVMASSPTMAQPKKPIVAVFTIEDKGTRLKKKLLDRLSDFLAVTLAATGKYRVVPRDQLKKRLVAQKKRSYKKCYDQTCQIEIGKELAAQKSLSTVVMKLGSKCIVTSVLYNLRTAASESGASSEGGCSEDAIVASIKAVVRRLVHGGKAPAQTTTRRPVRYAGKGGLLIKSTPSGATVTIGGQVQGGKTPLTVRNLPAGEHELELRKGMYIGRQKAKVVANRFVKVTLAMRKVKRQLEVLSSPPEATVLLDGKKVGSTPVVIEAAEAGRHVIEIRKKGHVAARQVVVLGIADVKKSVNANLLQTGEISVHAEPAGALVSVDGQAAGHAPLKIEAGPGAHSVHIRQNGRKAITKEVKVVSGKTTEVRVHLRYTEAERVRLAKETEMAINVAPAKPPTRKLSVPVYKRWWFWTVIGAVVVGGTVGVVAGTQSGTGETAQVVPRNGP